jgi:AmmeMemoRadiSam system protein B
MIQSGSGVDNELVAFRAGRGYNLSMKKAFCLSLIVFAVMLAGQEVRPVRDDVGFCWQRPQMQRLMRLLASADGKNYPTRGMVAGISPHDDFLYAGKQYYPLFKNLRTKEAVIFGVTHAAPRKEINDPHGILILDEYRAWTGLSGEVGISPLREWIKDHLPKEDFMVSNQAHSLEHSIEALVPFLQYYNPGIKITPIMVTGMTFEKMDELSGHLAGVLAEYIHENKLQPGRDIFFLISADANHYGRDFNNIPFGEDENAHRQGTEQDQRIARDLVIGTLDKEKIRKLTQELWGDTYLDYRNTYWCGKYSIPFGLMAISKTLRLVTGRNLSGKLLRYSDTYTDGVLPLKNAGIGITAPYSLKHWVGFFSAGFYLE